MSRIFKGHVGVFRCLDLYMRLRNARFRLQ